MKNTFTTFHTTPITNILQSDMFIYDEYLRKYSSISSSNKPLVKSHKNKLGEQNYCWNGKYKYWIWENNLWRCFVSNVRGIGFEVKSNFSLNQAYDAWLDYVNKMS